MSIAVITFSPQGFVLARRLKTSLRGCRLFAHTAVERAAGAERFRSVRELTARLFPTVRGLVYIGPCGIAVRAIAGCLRGKLRDPAVVVADAGGRFAVSRTVSHTDC